MVELRETEGSLRLMMPVCALEDSRSEAARLSAEPIRAV